MQWRVIRVTSSGCSCRPATRTMVGTVTAADQASALSLAHTQFGQQGIVVEQVA